MKTLYRFIDTLTGKEITMIRMNEDDAWETLCNMFGTGYVFENIEKIFEKVC